MSFKAKPSNPRTRPRHARPRRFVANESRGRGGEYGAILQEYLLYSPSGSWMDLLPEDCDKEVQALHTLLELGVVEAWQDDLGTVRLYDGKTGKEWRS